MFISTLKYIFKFVVKFYKIFATILCIYLLYLVLSYRSAYTNTDNILLNLDDAVYATKGVAINNKDILVSKQLIDDNCFGVVTGDVSRIYVVIGQGVYPVIIYASDNISGLYVLRLAKYEDKLSNYALLQINQPNYTVNRRLITPFNINSPNTFDFQEVRISATKNNNFFVTTRSLFGRKHLIGSPLFNKNYLLQGIIREENSNYEQKNSRENILENIGLQKTYLATNLITIRRFLNRYNIRYSLAGENIAISSQPTDPTRSVFNIICMKKY